MEKIYVPEHLMSTLEAFEIMLADKHTIYMREVREAAPNLGSRSCVTGKTAALVDKGLLVRHGLHGDKNTAYSLPENFEELKSALVTVPTQKGGRRPGSINKTPPPGRPPFPEPKPEKLNGFPFVPKEELRMHLGKIIEGLETLQEHIRPALTLLLDLDRDFDRYAKVTKTLEELKDQIGGLRI